MWIACPVSCTSSASSPRPPSVRLSRIVGRPGCQAPSGRWCGRSPKVVYATGTGGRPARSRMSNTTPSAARSTPSEAWNAALIGSRASIGRAWLTSRCASPAQPPPVPRLHRRLAAGPRGLDERRAPALERGRRPGRDVVAVTPSARAFASIGERPARHRVTEAWMSARYGEFGPAVAVDAPPQRLEREQEPPAACIVGLLGQPREHLEARDRRGRPASVRRPSRRTPHRARARDACTPRGPGRPPRRHRRRGLPRSRAASSWRRSRGPRASSSTATASSARQDVRRHGIERGRAPPPSPPPPHPRAPTRPQARRARGRRRGGRGRIVPRDTRPRPARRARSPSCPHGSTNPRGDGRVCHDRRHGAHLPRRRAHGHRVAPSRRHRPRPGPHRLRHVPGRAGGHVAQSRPAGLRSGDARRGRPHPRAPRPLRPAAAARRAGVPRLRSCARRRRPSSPGWCCSTRRSCRSSSRSGTRDATAGIPNGQPRTTTRRTTRSTISSSSPPRVPWRRVARTRRSCCAPRAPR